MFRDRVSHIYGVSGKSQGPGELSESEQPLTFTVTLRSRARRCQIVRGGAINAVENPKLRSRKRSKRRRQLICHEQS